MGRVPEYHKLPECLTRDLACHEILDIVPDPIVRHEAFDDIVIVLGPPPATYNEIEPLFAHLREAQDIQAAAFCIGHT